MIQEKQDKKDKAGMDMLEAFNEFIAYNTEAQQILDIEGDTLTEERLTYIHAEHERLKNKWKAQVFDFLVLTDHTAEDIRRYLSEKKDV